MIEPPSNKPPHRLWRAAMGTALKRSDAEWSLEDAERRKGSAPPVSRRTRLVHGAGDERGSGRRSTRPRGVRSRSSPVRLCRSSSLSASPLRGLYDRLRKGPLAADGWFGVKGFAFYPPNNPVSLVRATGVAPPRPSVVSPPLLVVPPAPLLRKCSPIPASCSPCEQTASGCQQLADVTVEGLTPAAPCPSEAAPSKVQSGSGGGETSAAAAGPGRARHRAGSGVGTPSEANHKGKRSVSVDERAGGECEWYGGVRALRDSHVRLVLRQLRHVARLNRALDRAVTAAATACDAPSVHTPA